MKTAQELLDDTFLSADAHKKHATSLRRVAGGIHNELDRSSISGLSKSDIATLQSAESILRKLAGVHAETSKLAGKKQQAREVREKAAEKAMAGNFKTLASVADKVCFLIAAAPSNFKLLELGKDASYLQYYFDDALRWVPYEISRKEGEVAVLLEEAWQRFNAKRPEYEQRGKDLIARLSMN